MSHCSITQESKKMDTANKESSHPSYNPDFKSRKEFIVSIQQLIKDYASESYKRYYQDAIIKVVQIYFNRGIYLTAITAFLLAFFRKHNLIINDINMSTMVEETLVELDMNKELKYNMCSSKTFNNESLCFLSMQSGYYYDKQWFRELLRYLNFLEWKGIHVPHLQVYKTHKTILEITLVRKILSELSSHYQGEKYKIMKIATEYKLADLVRSLYPGDKIFDFLEATI